jgi:hypothetical protein
LDDQVKTVYMHPYLAPEIVRQREGELRRSAGGYSLAHSVAAVSTTRAVMGAGAAVIVPATVSLLITMEPG